MTAAEEEAAAEVRWHRLLCWERYAPCVYERRSPELPLLRGEHLGYAESLALEAATALGCLTLTCALIVIGATTAYRGSALISAVIALAAVGGLSAAAVVGLAAIRTVLSLRPLGRRAARSAAPPQLEARLVQPAAPRVSALAALQPPASVALGGSTAPHTTGADAVPCGSSKASKSCHSGTKPWRGANKRKNCEQRKERIVSNRKELWTHKKEMKNGPRGHGGAARSYPEREPKRRAAPRASTPADPRAHPRRLPRRPPS